MLLKSVLICIVSFVLIYDPSIAVKSFRESYELIINILLPSMLPFMIISQIVVLTDIKNVIAFPVKVIFKILRLPCDLASFFLCSVIGGYPTGIKALCAGCESKNLTEQRAREYLPFLINAGPGFVIMAVGKIMFGSVGLGVIFYISEVLSSLVIGKILYRENECSISKARRGMPFSDALIISVNDSSEAMVGICGFVLFFSLITSIIKKVLGDCFFSSFISSIMEVTNGCKTASGLERGYLLASFLISFSGISCLYQIKAIAYKNNIKTAKIIFIKLFEGILAVLITFLLVKLYPVTVTAVTLKTPPLCAYSPNRLLETILIGMMFCQIFVNTDFSKA